MDITQSKRQEDLIKILALSQEYVINNQEVPIEYARVLFPPARREYELTYYGKQTIQDVINRTISVPFQKERSFGKASDWENKLIFGDNLQVLKQLVDMKNIGRLKNADGTDGVRLIYIDPPFSTRKDFKASGDDQKAYADKIAGVEFLEWLRKRLILLKELLADNGTIYVHLDYRKGHYIKVLMDEIFGEKNFKNEIIWHYQTYQGQTKNYYPRKHDSIFVYSKSNIPVFYLQKDDNPENTIDYTRWNSYLNENNEITGAKYPTTDSRFKGYYERFVKENGREPKDTDVILKIIGNTVDSVWNIKAVDPKDKTERVGYPTQKPKKLLERIIKGSTNEGDIVLDCFAGSGTTATVAEEMRRRWITCDVGKLSIYTIQKRLLSIANVSPFSLYSAGLYDEEKLNEFDEIEWKHFSLALWNCQSNHSVIKGVEFDGIREGKHVKVFSPHELRILKANISIETLQDMQRRLNGSAGSEIFVIAPKGKFSFTEDEIEIGNVLFHILRIPYSLLAHFTDKFSAPIQPNNIESVNEGIDAVGFDFIQPPEVEFTIENSFLNILKFETKSHIKGIEQSHGIDTFSMLLIDYNYNGQVFDLDDVYYASNFKDGQIKINNIKTRSMFIFIDKFGNERRVLVDGK